MAKRRDDTDEDKPAKRSKKQDRHKTVESVLGARPFRLCAPGDNACGNTDTFPHGAILPPVNVNVRPGFHYTTGTAIPKRSADDRRAHDCEETSKGKFTGRLKNGKPSSFCKAFSAPCGDPKKPRAGCPVQLTFIDGKPNLRFCNKPGEPGYLVPVSSPAEADRLAREACDKWPNKPKAAVKWPVKFFEKHAPQLIETARHAHPQSPWGVPGLGGIELQPSDYSSDGSPRTARAKRAHAQDQARRVPAKRANPAWLAAGVAMGVMAAVLIKNRQPATATP
jgi:hypothetical protein